MAWAPDYVDETDDFGSYLRIDDLEDSAEMALAITAASRAVDDHCNRQFGLVDAAEERIYCPEWRRGRWVVDIDDLMTTDDLTVELDGTPVTVFLLEPRNAAQKARPWTRIVFTDDSEVTPTTGSEEVAAVALWGWATVQQPIKQATLLQANRLLWRRNAPAGVAGSPEAGSETRLLAKVDPDVAVSLRGYRRMRAVG